MADASLEHRLEALVDLVLEVAGGNYTARVDPSERGDTVDAATVGLNLMAESLELERDRRRRAEALLRDEVHAYEQAPAGFCSIDSRSTEIVKCNETLARTLGIRKEDLLERRRAHSGGATAVASRAGSHERARARPRRHRAARVCRAERAGAGPAQPDGERPGRHAPRGAAGDPHGDGCRGRSESARAARSAGRRGWDGTGGPRASCRAVLHDEARHGRLRARARGVRAHRGALGGTLALSSEPGRGTRVEIRIPLGAPVSATPPVVPPVKLRGGPPRAGRILVVDDEPLVLRLLVSTLERGGYEVRAADGLAAALERAGEPGDIDLVVTDVVMPGGSGVDLANTLWRSRHDLGVVFVSGYTGSSVDSELLARPNVRFLGKPLAPRELLDLVGELVA